MYKILIAFCFLTISLGCTSKRKASQGSQYQLVETLIDDLIESENLEKQAFIIEHVYPIQYYKVEISEDGLEIPPPDYNSRNEMGIINWIEMDLFPKNEQTLNHVRSQIEGSTSKAKFDFGSKSIDPKKIDFEKPYYMVFNPIYNLDSTAVYLEIDYHDNYYGDGRAFVFELKNESWKNVKFIPTWIK